MSQLPSSTPPSFTTRLQHFIWGNPDAQLPERTRQRVARYLIPFLFFLYILAYLDRANVSVAMEGMVKGTALGGLDFSKAICGFGTGLFFWGYWILEIPSTQSVLTYGARWVFVRILILWGISCALIGFIGMGWFNDLFPWLPGVSSWPLSFLFPHRNELPLQESIPTLLASLHGCAAIGSPLPLLGTNLIPQPDDHVVAQFYFLRFMLGLFEGGFFPAVILYLSIWFRPQDRARAIATFMAAIPFSLLIGTPLSQFMLGINWLNIPGWRWVYIIQGLIPFLVGFVTLFFLPDRPEKAKWLPEDEKRWLIDELARDQQSKVAHGHGGWGGQIGIVLLMTFYYFCMNVTSYGLSTFMPDLIKSQSGLRSDHAGYLAGLPYFFGLIGMLANGWHSDKTGERILHVAVPLVGLSVGLFLTAFTVGFGNGPLATLFLIVLVGTCMYAHLPAFWPLPSTFMGAASAAAAIGFINMIGNLGGFVGPTLFGAAAAKKQYATGLYMLAPFPLVSVAIIMLVGYLRRDRLRVTKVE